jgi:dihydrofolate reductase
LAGDIVENVNAIKKSKGKDIWLFGGAELTAQMMNENLVDELLLSIHPIILGKGKALFSSLATRKTLKLLDTKAYSSGLVTHHYKVIK